METWLECPRSEGRYLVSDMGNVKNALTGTPVKPCWRGKYLFFTIHLSGRRIGVTLHRMVLEAFVGPAPEGTVGAHLDGDAANCRLSNLAWVTPEANESHKLIHGTDMRGEKSPHARFTDAEADLVRKAHTLGLSACEIARLTRVNQSTIYKIVGGKRYAHG